MKYVSIDIETAGLSRDCSLLEFGAVLDDLANPKPIESLPTFHCYLVNDKIVGEPYALAMHKTILERIAKREEPYTYFRPQVDLDPAFRQFLVKNGYTMISSGGEWDAHYVEITVAGKNYASFDRDWLEPLFKTIKVHHRVIDPAMLYFKIGDRTLPNTKECMKRAKIDGEVAHTAIDDAKGVIQLLRRHYYH